MHRPWESGGGYENAHPRAKRTSGVGTLLCFTKTGVGCIPGTNRRQGVFVLV